MRKKHLSRFPNLREIGSSNLTICCLLAYYPPTGSPMKISGVNEARGSTPSIDFVRLSNTRSRGIRTRSCGSNFRDRVSSHRTMEVPSWILLVWAAADPRIVRVSEFATDMAVIQACATPARSASRILAAAFIGLFA